MARKQETSAASRVSRRSILGAAGGSMIGLAGCLGSLGDEAPDQITFGATVPLSGPFELNGRKQRTAIRMAADHAMEQGDVDADVEVLFADSESDPAVAQRQAQGHLDEGADFTTGGVSSAVAASLGELAMRRGHLHLGGAGDATITGENCMSNVFIFSDSAIQQTNGGLGYPLREGLGDSVFEISSDFAWGQSIQDWDGNHLVPEYGAEYLGNRWTQFGTEDFSEALIDARESEADIINLAQFGADQIASLRQAEEFGLMDGERIITTPATSMAFARGVGAEIFSYENLYAGLHYHYTLDTAANDEFVSAFRERSDGEPPFVYTPAYYIAMRTTLQVVNEVGSTNADDVRPELRGREVHPQLWNEGERMRACDHRFTAPTMTVQGLPVEEADYENWNIFEIVEAPAELEEFMRPCDETGCGMDV